MNLYVHCQKANQWHENDRFYLDDFEYCDPDTEQRDASSVLYYRKGCRQLFHTFPTFFVSEEEATRSAQNDGFVVLNGEFGLLAYLGAIEDAAEKLIEYINDPSSPRFTVCNEVLNLRKALYPGKA